MLSEDQFWEHICVMLHAEKPKKPLWKQVLKDAYQENKEVFSLIHDLRNNNYSIGLLSNTEPPATELFYELSYKLFDGVVFSCDEKMCKPDNKIFELMLRRLNVQADETVFIDDRKENILAAEKLRIHCILFKEYDQCEKELLQIGVRIK
jgi:epoxide hydrolase-like predicted phosphatase